jgi:translation initiation factor IF-2
MRVFELAKKLDIPNKELIELIEMEGIEVHNHFSVLNDEQVLIVTQAATGEKPLPLSLKKQATAKPQRKLRLKPPSPKPRRRKLPPGRCSKKPPRRIALRFLKILW